jgi:YbgC/YbaW family acyl-CoA thioester hydrolase
MIFSYDVLIKEHHLDTYGHVNNATYLQLFEEARWDIITARGYGFQRVHSTSQGPVILEISLKFLKELKLREPIKITLDLLSYEGKIFKMKQQMLKENGEVACEALFTAAFFDLRERRIIAPSPEWLYAIGLS